MEEDEGPCDLSLQLEDDEAVCVAGANRRTASPLSPVSFPAGHDMVSKRRRPRSGGGLGVFYGFMEHTCTDGLDVLICPRGPGAPMRSRYRYDRSVCGRRTDAYRKLRQHHTIIRLRLFAAFAEVPYRISAGWSPFLIPRAIRTL